MFLKKSSKEAVPNLSMNLNSSLLHCCGNTFLTTKMLNVSKETKSEEAYLLNADKFTRKKPLSKYYI